MLGLIITSVVLIVIMLVFVFILFKNIIKRIDDNAKTYFVNKMHNFDYLLEEKQEDLKKLNEKIEEIKAENENIINGESDKDIKDLIKNDDYSSKNNRNTIQTKILLNVPEYRDATTFFKNYKKIKKIFTINNEKIINSFVEKNKNSKDEKIYKKLEKIREKFDNDAIYECMTLSSENQINVVEESLTTTEKKFLKFDETVDKENFNLNDFINDIENKMRLYDPTIYVYVNEVNSNYNNIDKNIVTKQYKNMAEGIIIEYKNKIYDYSI